MVKILPRRADNSENEWDYTASVISIQLGIRREGCGTPEEVRACSSDWETEDRRLWTSGQGDKLYLFPVLPRKQNKTKPPKGSERNDQSCLWPREKKNHLLLLSGSVTSDSLWPHGLQHVSLPCPSPSPEACSNSCPFSQWCRPAILTSAAQFSFCLQEASEGHDQSCLWLRAQAGVCVSSSHPSGHTVGWHVSAPASSQPHAEAVETRSLTRTLADRGAVWPALLSSPCCGRWRLPTDPRDHVNRGLWM